LIHGPHRRARSPGTRPSDARRMTGRVAGLNIFAAASSAGSSRKGTPPARSVASDPKSSSFGDHFFVGAKCRNSIKPVQNYVSLGRCHLLRPAGREHQEALAIGRHIVIGGPEWSYFRRECQFYRAARRDGLQRISIKNETACGQISAASFSFSVPSALCGPMKAWPVPG
jgi:hypothetical protein